MDAEHLVATGIDHLDRDALGRAAGKGSETVPESLAKASSSSVAPRAFPSFDQAERSGKRQHSMRGAGGGHGTFSFPTARPVHVALQYKLQFPRVRTVNYGACADSR